MSIEDAMKNPISLEHWYSYSPYSPEDAILFQSDNLIEIPIEVQPDSRIHFIWTKKFGYLHNELMKHMQVLSVVDTKVVLEDEAFYTATLEGAKTTRKRTAELHDGQHIDAQNAKSEYMVLNGFHATQYLDENVKFPMSSNIVYGTWNLIVDNCCENVEIKGDMFRSGDVCVGAYVPPSWEYVPDMVEQWVNFYNSKTLNDYPILKAILLHCSFELIHPFCDGNGRAGRLLSTNYLIQQGLNCFKAVSISRQICANHRPYYNSLSDCSNAYFDCTTFVDAMLQYYIDALKSAQVTMKYGFNYYDYKYTESDITMRELKTNAMLKQIKENPALKGMSIESLANTLSPALSKIHGLTSTVDKAFATMCSILGI